MLGTERSSSSMRLSVGEVLRVLRARWWVLLLAAAIGAGSAYLYTKLPWVEPRWKSSVSLQATGRLDYGTALALERNLRQLAEGVRQLSVMREVDRKLHLDVPSERMLANTKAEPIIDATQIRIDYEDADAGRTEATALEMASVYVQEHNARQAGKFREEQVFLSVLDRPSAASLSWPQTRVLVPAAALLGLLAAAGIVTLLASLDDTLKSGADVAEYLDLPLIGQVPVLGSGRSDTRMSRLPISVGRARDPEPAVAAPRR